MAGRPLNKAGDNQPEIHHQANHVFRLIDPAGRTVEQRIRPPRGFIRVSAPENSFGAYLRRLPLKPHGANVRLHDGRIKPNHGIYDAVVDLNIGNKDLHQCADAVIRLRADYLYQQKQFEKIHFNFSNGFRADYAQWKKGYHIVVRGNQAYWTPSHGPTDSHQNFWEYLETVFNYAGTLSLANELKPASLDTLQIGDIFIHGGSPGHAVIVIDLASNPQNGENIFLLAQSYMPAQEIQILKNPNDPQRSPWYSTEFGGMLTTPEWTFHRTELKRFTEF
ncbi:MAG: DUF4846 domain-containing protein [Candidatus Aminicenantes bacterium]|nr:DUF4846 domain-containing protein [Candidatus Aminicenantes bacterium]